VSYLFKINDMRPKYVYNIRRYRNRLPPAVNMYNTNGGIHALVNVKIHIVTTTILTNYARKLTLISSASDENPRP